jgi:hypothetical protein
MKISPFDAFLMYMAIRNHFRTRYDYFKYHGKVNITADHFNTRKDKFVFMKLCRMYDDTDLKDLYISNFVREHPRNFWPGDLVTDIAKDCMLDWQKKQQSLSYIYDNELNVLFENVQNPNDIFKVEDGQYPLIYQYYSQGKLSIQTLCILDREIGFNSKLKKKFDKDDFLWGIFTDLITKLEKFIEYDHAKMASILNKHLKEKSNVI